MRRRFLAPDVAQESYLECGAAALSCVLQGFDIPFSQQRLQDALQPTLLVTTLDRLGEVGTEFGLEVSLRHAPIDHLFLPQADNLPAIVVARPREGIIGSRFLVAWRAHGASVQVMDPSVGLRWPRQQRLLDELEVSTRSIAASEWREWAVASGFCDLLHQRLLDLHVAETLAVRLAGEALDDPGWRSLAALDAAIRAVDAGVRAGAWLAGDDAGGMIEHLVEDSRAHPPKHYWSVVSSPDPDPAQSERLLLREIVFLRVDPHAQVLHSESPAPAGDVVPSARPPKTGQGNAPGLRPERELWQTVRADGLLSPAVLTAGLAVSSAAVALEALLLKGMLQVGQGLGVAERVGILAALLVLFGALVALELPISTTVVRLARRLETRLRISLLEKIPRLSHRYFAGRSIADLNRRAYALRDLREVPNVAARMIRGTFQLIVTAGCIIWMEPSNALLVGLSIVYLVGAVRVAFPFVGIPSYRVALHANALNHFYLDALLGLLPTRTHGAERSIRREHESRLVELLHTDVRLSGRLGIFFLLLTLGSAAITIGIVFNYVERGGTSTNLVLLTYWALEIPVLSEAIGGAVIQYLRPSRTTVQSLCQVLDSPEEAADATAGEPPASRPVADTEAPTTGVSITIDGVSLCAGSSAILADIHVAFKAAEHVAIVGASGAGKTSLVGLLLGRHRPTVGHVLVDGGVLDGDRLAALRKETAWVDTGVQLWNRTLFENLRYGTPGSPDSALGHVIDDADLFNVLTTLPNGLQSVLGESGRLVSGGEGQRVRLGRGLFRQGVRLVILDEPFRALDRPSRRVLLGRARRYWRGATLVMISHDVADVLDFERVLVIERGRVVEDGVPSVLAREPGSRYRSLLDADAEARQALWESTAWRRLWLEDGQLREGEDSSRG
ncbi:MAG: ATP-binding cassette domain-containing protein [Acidobacteriota bacterium]